MKDSEEIKAPLLRLEHYIWTLAVVWTVVIAASLVWNVYHKKEEIFAEGRTQARVAYEKDVIYRRWNAGHGGVYVPVTEETQPNPYLSDVPERDITAPSGKRLTLMNPAYMTRKVHELEKKKHGVRGHITSLNLIRPENAPDSWETEALRAFERGETEISSVERIENKEYMRLMRPLITEKGCLRCHAKQGYHEGDIRGGISVSIPMESLRAIEHKSILTFALAHGLLWLVGLIGIGIGTQRLRQSELERKQAEIEIKKLNKELKNNVVQLEAANNELESFSYSVSHDLRTPLRSIDGFSQVLLEDYANKLDGEGRETLQRVRNGTQRMAQLIDDLLKLSRVTRGEMRQEMVDLSSMAKAVLTEFQKMEPERQAKFIIAEGLTANGDTRLLRVVLENLMGNAWKFTSKKENACIELGSLQQGDGKLAYFVKDNGAGFDMSYVDKLFGAFQRLHSRTEYPGTGIGLATVQRIIRRHGGRVWAEGSVGQGATMYFTLP